MHCQFCQNQAQSTIKSITETETNELIENTIHVCLNCKDSHCSRPSKQTPAVHQPISNHQKLSFTCTNGRATKCPKSDFPSKLKKTPIVKDPELLIENCNYIPKEFYIPLLDIIHTERLRNFSKYIYLRSKDADVSNDALQHLVCAMIVDFLRPVLEDLHLMVQESTKMSQHPLISLADVQYALKLNKQQNNDVSFTEKLHFLKKELELKCNQGPIFGKKRNLAEMQRNEFHQNQLEFITRVLNYLE